MFLRATHDEYSFFSRPGDMQGEGTILGSVLVVSSTGEVLFHHREKVWGDHPDDDALKAAIAQL